MKTNRPTYQRLAHLTTLLLLMALLVPSGLHAKQLVELCMDDYSTTEMSADHSCCESDAEPAKQHDAKTSHHDCVWGFICDCSIGQSQLADSEWILSNQHFSVTITESEDSVPFLTTDEPIHPDQIKRSSQHDPPLWLLYDTFLN